MNKSIILFTDGSCLGNPGPGGYSAILYYKKYRKILTAGFYNTTNNRMELMAVIVGLKALNQSCNVSIYTDSQYVKKGTNIWIKQWKKKGWFTPNKKKIKNIDLWIKLNKVLNLHNTTWIWIKSHSGNIKNELCDKIAKTSAKNPQFIDFLYK
ncbi:Ribonuclease HI [Buchnera aphidicola (Anoecia corni)]|uniref:Ribonuclease H n=1 Tax=Buchnera aphidicola (Anoecia corni) TaxID=2994477 RepID=A0AAT9IGV5_9GAMM